MKPRHPAPLLLAAALAVPATAQVTDPAVIDTYGPTCGPTLTATDQIGGFGQHMLTFSVSGAFPLQPVGVLFGVSQVAWPIPGSACQLLTAPLVSITGFATLAGTAHFALAVPPALEGQFFAQAVSLDFQQAAIATSNGLDLYFPGQSPTADPTTQTSYPCYYISNYTWNYGGDGVPSVTGKIRWPSNTCSSQDGPPAGRPVMVFMHGNGMTHTDHDYLMAHLARNGVVTVSIANGSFLGGSNEGRARQAISFLNSLHRFWTWRSRLSNDVIFAGHSRGGEAAVTAARLLAEQPALAYTPYDVEAVISIAPTDGGGDNSDPKENLDGTMTESFLGIYGSRDPDVRGIRLEDPLNGPENTVFAIYDRAGTESSVEGILLPQANIEKSLVYVHGATHTGFAETCSGVAFAPVSCTEHQEVAKGYFNAFIRWQVLGQVAYRAYFDGTATPTKVRVADTEVFTQLSDHPRRVLDNFEQGGWAQNTRGGSVTKTSGIAQIAEGELWQLDPSAPHDTRGLRVKWSTGLGLPRLRWEIPNDDIPLVGSARDVSNHTVLSLRVAQDYHDAWNTTGVDQDFYVRLYTGSGASPLVRISDFGRIPYPDHFFTHPYPYPAGDYTKTALSTIRVPLSAFAGADLSDVRSVYLYFTVPGRTAGSVILDSLEFAR